jgi:hypothetical protein
MNKEQYKDNLKFNYEKAMAIVGLSIVNSKLSNSKSVN